jgi:hypothetical protein
MPQIQLTSDEIASVQTSLDGDSDAVGLIERMFRPKWSSARYNEVRYTSVVVGFLPLRLLRQFRSPDLAPELCMIENANNDAVAEELRHVANEVCDDGTIE